MLAKYVCDKQISTQSNHQPTNTCLLYIQKIKCSPGYMQTPRVRLLITAQNCLNTKLCLLWKNRMLSWILNFAVFKVFAMYFNFCDGNVMARYVNSFREKRTRINYMNFRAHQTDTGYLHTTIISLVASLTRYHCKGSASSASTSCLSPLLSLLHHGSPTFPISNTHDKQTRIT